MREEWILSVYVPSLAGGSEQSYAQAEIGWLRPLKYDFSRSLISSKCSGCWQKVHSAEEWGFSPRPTSFHVCTSLSVEGKKRVHFDKSQIHHFTLALNVYYTTVTRLLDLLTNKVFHHLRGVVRCWGDTQKLISPGNGGIIDGLHVNAVTTHHEVTHLCVFLSIGYLEIIQRQPPPLERGEMLLIVM